MKKIIILAWFVFASAIAYSQTGSLFQITGSLQGIPEAEQVFIKYHQNGKYITDTAKVTDSSYSFTGTIAEPQVFTIWMKYKSTSNKAWRSENKLEIYLTDGITNLHSANYLTNVEATGEGAIWNKDFTALNDQIKKMEDSTKYWTKQYEQIGNRYSQYIQKKSLSSYTYADFRRDSLELKRIDAQKIEGLNKELNENVLIPYIQKNPKSPVAYYALRAVSDVVKAGVIKEYKRCQTLYDLLSSEIKNYYAPTVFKQYLDRAAKTAEGNPAPDIILPNEKGEVFSLSSLKGKYVLVHFWASWCGPCRSTNPELERVYNKYKDKGFVILGVSTDNGEAEWKKALVEDKAPWYQVRDEKSAIKTLFEVSAIPRNFLIGPDGKVITRDIYASSVDETLQKLFNSAK